MMNHKRELKTIISTLSNIRSYLIKFLLHYILLCIKYIYDLERKGVI